MANGTPPGDPSSILQFLAQMYQLSGKPPGWGGGVNAQGQPAVSMPSLPPLAQRMALWNALDAQRQGSSGSSMPPAQQAIQTAARKVGPASPQVMGPMPPIVPLSEQSYPSEAEANEKVGMGFGYGSGFEQSLQPGARIINANALKGNTEDELINQAARAIGSVDPAAVPIFRQGAVAANRSAVSGLGFDPSKVSLYKGKSPFDLGLGTYDDKKDVIWMSDQGGPSSIVHESTHRGLQKLRDAGVLSPEEKKWIDASDKSGDNDERFVRWTMHHTMGDPEGKVAGDKGDKEDRADGIRFFTTDKNAAYNRKMYDEIEKKAADLIARNRQFGPH